MPGYASIKKWYTSIKKWWMKLFGVRFMDNVPGWVRGTCGRYGQQVIATMLAGEFTPSTPDLQALYLSDETRLQTRDWLTESTDGAGMVDVWKKQSPSGKTVTFKIEGSKDAGFVYSAMMEGRAVKEISGTLKELNRAEVEALFADYAAEG